MWKKVRFYYWLVKGFVSKHKWVLFPAALIGAVAFFQVPFVLEYLPKPKTTSYVGRVGRYNLSNLPRDIQNKMSHGLTYIDESGNPQPALASDWKILDDGKTYIFTLKDDIYWQDGTPILATDIDYKITDVETAILDEKSISFKLKEPYAAFPSVVSQPLFRREQFSYLQVVDRTKIIGSAEYSLEKLKFDGSNLDSLVIENEHEKIVYTFFPTEEAAILAFKLAEIDAIEELSNIDEFSSWTRLDISKELDNHQYATVFFNVEDGNLAEKKVRQALAYAIPKTTDSNIRALGPLSPTSWAYNPNVKPYQYSIETAEELLDGLKRDFELELTTTPNFVSLAEEIKASWEQLGIQVQIKVVNLPDINNYQALLIGQRIPSDPDQYLLWHSTQDSNITNYQSAKVDKLLEDGRKELSQEKREEIYLDFQRFLVEDTPAVFLHFLESYTVQRV